MQRPDFDDPDLPLSEFFAEWPDASLVFLAKRMLCPGCLVAPFHTISDACEEYGLDEEEFRTELKRWVARDDDSITCDASGSWRPL